jgi:hypothetical protein
MGLDIYWTGLVIMVPCVGLVAGRKFVLGPLMRTLETEKGQQIPLDYEARKFRKIFLQVYLLVMRSDWHQVSLRPFPFFLGVHMEAAI